LPLLPQSWLQAGGSTSGVQIGAGLVRSLDLGVISMREKRENKAVAVALKETSVAASTTTTTTLAGAECKPSGPCSGGCACEADKAAAVVAQKQQQGAAEEEEDVAATGAEEAVVDVERLQKELLDLTETLLAEVTYPFDVTSFASVWIVVWKTGYVESGGADVGRTV